jgi:hypothetical protein
MRESTNEQVVRYFAKTAAKYDRQMAFYERFVLGDARRWALSQAVRGHEKVPTGGQVGVPTGGRLEVPAPRVSCPE